MTTARVPRGKTEKTLDLAGRMRDKRQAGERPYVLVLGAGASISSGTRLNRAVVERVVGSYDLDAFDKRLGQCSDMERFAILRRLVEGASPSPGYQSLARLIHSGYFSEILSTNFDPLLEDAIACIQMRRRDYVSLVHGVMEPDLIARLIDSPVPRVKVLKLHGDLFYRKFFYTGNEISQFPPPLARCLGTLLNYRDVLVVGHGMADGDINRCLEPKGGALWYVNPSPPSKGLADLMNARTSKRNCVSGSEGEFDAFFVHLESLLLGGTADIGVDRIAQSIFSLSSESRAAPIGSAFLIGDTDLLVSDSSVLAGLGQGKKLGVTAQARAFAGGPEREARLVVAPKEELDYAVFRVAGIVEHSPLQLAEELPSAGEPVTACISVGGTQGFRDGHVTRIDISVPIAMGGGVSRMIRHLIETDVHIEPGACGSPLVNKDGRVVGTLVAGNGRSYALTSVRLRKMLVGARLLRNRGR